MTSVVFSDVASFSRTFSTPEIPSRRARLGQFVGLLEAHGRIVAEPPGVSTLAHRQRIATRWRFIPDNGADSGHQLLRDGLDLVRRSHVLDGYYHQLAFVLCM
jgi:hypothetical protein